VSLQQTALVKLSKAKATGAKQETKEQAHQKQAAANAFSGTRVL